MSFRYSEYTKIISLLRSHNFAFFTVKDFLENKINPMGPSRSVVIRHDVDRFPYKSVYFSKLEYDLNIRSTYYFRTSRNQRFPNKAIQHIQSYGHEIGYHYETLSKMR